MVFVCFNDDVDDVWMFLLYDWVLCKKEICCRKYARTGR